MNSYVSCSLAVKLPLLKQRSNWLDLATLAAFCAFLFFFGLGAIGLTGADEPRYAQIAREMLARHDWITPVLYGKPWLEKPVFYYWLTIVSYKLFGVSDWAARVPSAFCASAMVFAIYGFFARSWQFRVSSLESRNDSREMRNAKRDTALNAALITASSAAIVGFSRAASTDMPLAATFTIAMLCWAVPLCAFVSSVVDSEDSEPQGTQGYTESARRASLLGFYFCMALATLAKGPVAAGLAALIIVVYAALTRGWRVVKHTLWWPGILLFVAVAAPWYVAVQRANPQFAREFFLEQNLARFGTNLYRHKQPFWYYLPVLAASLVPWVVFAVCALVKEIKDTKPKRVQRNAEGRLRIFLLIWAVVPIVFFSMSQSKLPGYILPAIPAWTMLLALAVSNRTSAAKPRWALLLAHSLISATLLFAAVVVPYSRALSGRALAPYGRHPYELVVATILALMLFAAIVISLRKFGLQHLRFVTLIAVILALAYVIRVDAPSLDGKLSARVISQQIAATVPPGASIAVFHARREVEYGLAFYFDRPIANYDRNEAPTTPHLVVAPMGSADALKQAATGRRVSHVGQFAPQHLELFWISAAGPASMPN